MREESVHEINCHAFEDKSPYLWYWPAFYLGVAIVWWALPIGVASALTRTGLRSSGLSALRREVLRLPSDVPRLICRLAGEVAEPDVSPQPGLALLDELVDRTRTAGVPVD